MPERQRPIQGLGSSRLNDSQRLGRETRINEPSDDGDGLENLQRALEAGSMTVTGRDHDGVALGDATVPDASMITNKARKIEITNLDYGYLINIGCHSFAIGKYKKLVKLLAEYLANPQATEKKWYNNQLKIKRNISA